MKPSLGIALFGPVSDRDHHDKFPVQVIPVSFYPTGVPLYGKGDSVPLASWERELLGTGAAGPNEAALRAYEDDRADGWVAARP